MQTDKKNCFFCVRNKITFDSISYLLSCNNLTMSFPINNTITLSFFQKCYFTAWFGADLFLVVERSKDITNVKILPSLVAKISDICDVNVNSLLFNRLVICMLRNSAYILCKLILKLSQVLYIMFSA